MMMLMVQLFSIVAYQILHAVLSILFGSVYTSLLFALCVYVLSFITLARHEVLTLTKEHYICYSGDSK
jgi:hypothetical protein